jgi:transcriptional regulator with XRE-family HTH domain
MMSLVQWQPNIRAIEEARLRRAWTLRRLSTESHVSYPTVLNLLLGRTKPNFGTLGQLGRALGLSTAELIRIVDAEDPIAVAEKAS